MATAEEIRNMLSTGQAETTSMIATIDGQRDAAQDSLIQVQRPEDSRSSQQDDDDRKSAILAIGEEVAMLRASKGVLRAIIVSMQTMLAEFDAGGAGKVSTNVLFGANNHGFQVGTVSGPISGISFGRS